jgi:hypothetical protein
MRKIILKIGTLAFSLSFIIISITTPLERINGVLDGFFNIVYAVELVDDCTNEKPCSPEQQDDKVRRYEWCDYGPGEGLYWWRCRNESDWCCHAACATDCGVE